MRVMNKKFFSDDAYQIKGTDVYPQSEEDKDDWEMVDHPSHYTQGRYEAIDVIEDAIAEAPTAMAGMCQGNALKYLLRLWHKIDAKEDAMKARWYLDKLIELLN